MIASAIITTVITDQNPFHYGSPVTGDRFTDRDAELAALLTCMRQRQKAVLLSPRRYGKTSLLKRAIHDLRAEGGRAGMVSLIGCSSRRQVAQTLATAVARELIGGVEGRFEQVREQLAGVRASLSLEVTHEGMKVSLAPSRADSDWSEVIGDVLRLLTRLAERDRPVSLVIDEFQRVAEINAGLPGVFKALVDELENASLVFAGSKLHLMEQLSEGSGAPLLQVGTKISLAPIPKALMVPFLEDRARSGGKELVAAELIYDLTRGVPNDVQQLAFWAFQEPAATIDADAVQQALDRLVALQAEDFADSFDKLAPSQQRLLEALAEGAVNDPYTRRMLERVEVANANAIRVALRRLGDLELVDHSPAGWRVASAFFERWLQRQGEF
jgi:hypothetical protein